MQVHRKILEPNSFIMRPKLNFLISTISAAIIPTIVFAIASAALDEEFRNRALVIVPSVFVVAFAHSVLLGSPVFLLLQRHKILRWWSLALAGLMIGILPAVSIAWLRGAKILENETLDSIKGIATLGLLGLIGGLSFWFAWNLLEGSDRN